MEIPSRAQPGAYPKPPGQSGAEMEENPVAESPQGAIFEGKTRKGTPSLGEKN